MIAVRIEASGAEFLTPGNDHAVLCGFGFDAETFQVIDRGGDAVGLFDPQFFGILHNESVFAGGSENRENGDFVDQGSGYILLNGSTANGGVLDTYVADHLPIDLFQGGDGDAGSGGEKEIQQRGASGIEADPVQREIGTGDEERGDEKEGGGRKIRWYSEFAAGQNGEAFEGDHAIDNGDIRAEFTQGEFGVIARADRLADDGFAFGVETPKEDAGLYLGAGHGKGVVNGMEFGAVDGQGREFSVTRFDVRSHTGKRLHDAAHGPAGQRFVTDDAAGEWLGCENPSHHTDQGAGVAGVKIRFRGGPSVQTFAVYRDRSAILIYLYSQGANSVEGGVAIGASGVVADCRGVPGDGSKNRVPVRDGFVSRQNERTCQRSGRMNSLQHEWNSPSLPCGKKRVFADGTHRKNVVWESRYK